VRNGDEGEVWRGIRVDRAPMHGMCVSKPETLRVERKESALARCLACSGRSNVSK